MYIYIYVYFIILSFILMYILQTYIFSIVFYFCCWLVSYTSFSSWRLLHGLHHVFLIITVSSSHEHSLLCDESFTGAPVSPAPPLMVHLSCALLLQMLDSLFYFVYAVACLFLLQACSGVICTPWASPPVNARLSRFSNSTELTSQHPVRF